MHRSVSDLLYPVHVENTNVWSQLIRTSSAAAYFKIQLHFKNIKEETIVKHFCTRRSQDQPAFAGLTLNRRA